VCTVEISVSGKTLDSLSRREYLKEYLQAIDAWPRANPGNRAAGLGRALCEL
jgi:phage tail protein X